MKYPRAVISSLPDGSFFVCVPLLGNELRTFKKELFKTLRERGESFSGGKKDKFLFCFTFTSFSEGEIISVSNKIIEKIKKKKGEKNMAR